ncbi:hypothetical protein LSH36_606g04114 [Paralvinella palmiformis]|uniref:Disintegrin domain-containing protein n=1 Tax=Paralvinella palmiformis TaxID=53620 RepID=A0AAD9MUP3_9ANNE|nr:hypothetical protein LSH36_606g04114 [Paralvinella palmiformis]
MYKVTLFCGTISQHALHFSRCARISLEEALLGGLGTCLLESPPQVFPYAQAFQECRLKDPCCNPKTCLLQPWATCRYGDCCDNCTVVPANYMCRLAISQCDVPEFCDGVSGYVFSISEKMAREFSFSDFVLTMLWYRVAGRVRKEKAFVTRDVTCGLLHCEGGATVPNMGKDNVFSTTTVNSAGVNYECKIISSHNIEHFPYYGLVQDGTKCDNSSICLGGHCVSLATLTVGVCLLGDNGLICSGHGVSKRQIM